MQTTDSVILNTPDTPRVDATVRVQTYREPNMNFEVELMPGGIAPRRGTARSAGLDLFTKSDQLIFELAPGRRTIIRIGVRPRNIPEGYYARIAPRSGLALNHGIDVLAGVVDEDYRGEIGVVLINTDREKSFTIEQRYPIAQLILEPYLATDVRVVENPDTRLGATVTAATATLSDTTVTARGEAGFGSTTATSVAAVSAASRANTAVHAEAVAPALEAIALSSKIRADAIDKAARDDAKTQTTGVSSAETIIADAVKNIKLDADDVERRVKRYLETLTVANENDTVVRLRQAIQDAPESVYVGETKAFREAVERLTVTAINETVDSIKTRAVEEFVESYIEHGVLGKAGNMALAIATSRENRKRATLAANMFDVALKRIINHTVATLLLDKFRPMFDLMDVFVTTHLQEMVKNDADVSPTSDTNVSPINKA